MIWFCLGWKFNGVMMTNIPAEVRWNYPAILENVDRICIASAVFLDQYNLHRKDRFAINLLMREGLNNAVIHGCHNDAAMSISCRLVVSFQEVTIEIADSGPGFDWRSVSFAASEPDGESGRGLSIFALYASSIIYNDSGNGLTLKRIVNEGEIYARNTDHA
jgi:serine/threonine-protein kinase RsbW